MKTRTLSLLSLAAPLLFSGCNDALTGSKATSEVPVSFRLVGAKATTLDSTELVRIRSFVGDSAHRTRLDSLVRRWQDKEVALQVPLGQPLEFRFDGLNRRNGRLVAFWNALGFDTLRSGDRTANVVALNVTPRSDTAGPSDAALSLPTGSQRRTSGDTLYVALPTGQSSGSLSLPATLDSVYLAGKALAKDSATGWSLPVTRGQDLSLTVVNPNGTSSSWVVAIRSGDISGPAFLYAMTDGAASVLTKDTVFFTLPYVIDSALALTISNADPKDLVKSLTLGKNTLDVGESSWTISVKVPVAGDSAGIQHVLSAKDSLDNPTVQVVKILRPKSTRIPGLTWLNPPGAEPIGAHKATYRLQVVGGDSLTAPTFLAPSLNAPTTRLEATGNDTSIWLCDILLGDKDTGEVTARIGNLSGSVWNTAAKMVTRWDSTSADDIAPTLNILAPADSAWIASGTATVLSGTAWDERGGKVTVLVGHNGKTDTASWSAKDRTWSWTLNWAADGDSVLTVKARDSVGNPTKDVLWTLRRDTRKPSLKWGGTMKIARDTFFTNAAQLPLEALASDALNGKLRGILIARTGSTQPVHATYDTASSTWKTTLDLGGLDGTSAWLATASDSAGNDSIKGFWILRDTAKPSISVNTPSPSGIDKFAFSAQKDTLWISSDSFVTISVKATSGNVRIPLAALGVDSSGTLRSYSTLPQTLTIRQSAGTRSTRSLAVADSLGNVSDTLRLVVIGLDSIRTPAVTFGSSPAAAGLIDSLPWPKTAHMSCPTGTTLNIGTSTAKDSVIWTTTNLSLSCNGPKVRSNVVKYTWTIQDTASASSAFKPPTSDSTIALLVDSKDRKWLLSQSGQQSYVYRFSNDSSIWIAPVGTPGLYMTFDRIEAANGSSADGRRFFLRKSTSSGFTDWYSPEPENPGSGGFSSRAQALSMRSDTLLTGILCQYQNACLVRHAMNGSLIGDTLVESAFGSSFGEVHSLKNFDLTSILRQPGSGSGETSPSFVIFRTTGTTFSTVSFLGSVLASSTSGTTIASSNMDDMFFALGKGSDGNLWIQRRDTPASISFTSASIAIPVTVTAPGKLHAARGKNVLWLNIEGQGVYRFTEDLASYVFWPVTNAIGKPQTDSWGGTWLLLKVASGYSALHIKGLTQ